MKSKLPSMIQVDDLVQDGCIGLLEALENYDPSMGASFETYAGIRIRGSILDGLRKGAPARSIPRFRRAFDRAQGEIERTKLAPATNREVAEKLGLSIQDLTQKITAEDASRVVVTDFPGWFDPDLFDYDQMQSLHLRDPFEILDLEQRYVFLERALGELPDMERVVISMHVFEELDLHEIGEIFGFSESRACQIYREALTKLQISIDIMTSAVLSRECMVPA